MAPHEVMKRDVIPVLGQDGFESRPYEAVGPSIFTAITHAGCGRRPKV